VELTLRVHYTDDYPEELPELSLKAVDGELDDDEVTELLDKLRIVVRISRTCSTNGTKVMWKLPYQGRRERRNSNDIHPCFASTRAALVSSSIAGAKNKKKGSGKGATCFEGNFSHSPFAPYINTFYRKRKLGHGGHPLPSRPSKFGKPNSTKSLQ
jgi:hypothetical protein